MEFNTLEEALKHIDYLEALLKRERKKILQQALSVSEHAILESLLEKVESTLELDEKLDTFIIDRQNFRWGLERDEMNDFKTLCKKILEKKPT